jgi:hypothetical protein
MSHKHADWSNERKFMLIKNESDASKRIGYLILTLAVAAALSLNIFRAIDLDIFPNAPVWGVLHSIPAALSNIFVDSIPRYTYSTDVFNAYFITPWVLPDSSAGINEAISRISRMDFDKVDGSYLLLGNDDKGIVDLVEISLRIFGLRVESVAVSYYLLLFFSTSLFALQYFRRPIAMVAAACLLFSMYQFLPFITFYEQLVSPLAMRVMPMLSTIACLHCLLWYFYPQKSAFGVTALLLQVFLIIFVLHIRSTTIWQIQAIILVGTFAAALSWRAQRKVADLNFGKNLLVLLLPVVASTIGVASLHTYREFAYPQEYLRGEQILTRVMWHNIYSGFALHPILSKQESLRIDDMSVVTATGRYLKRIGREDLWKEMGGETNFTGIKWAQYDRLVRDMLVSTCTEKPAVCLQTFLVYKPYHYLNTLKWFYTVKNIPKVSDAFVSTYFGDVVKQQIITTTRRIKERNWTASPWTAGFALIWVFTVAGLVACHSRISHQEFICVGITAMFSAIPSIVGYPAPHGMIDSAVIVTAMIQVTTIVLTVLLIQKIQGRNRASVA